VTFLCPTRAEIPEVIQKAQDGEKHSSGEKKQIHPSGLGYSGRVFENS
jgi:hypothetical protein